MKFLFKDVTLIGTMNKDGKEIENGYLTVENGVITFVGDKEPKGNYDRVIDGRGKLLLPGFVNTHHHFYQTLFRNIKEVNDLKLFDWLIYLYEKWKNIDEEAVYVSTVIAILEMMKSGVTTTTDHLYLVPYNNVKIFDAQIEAAKLTKIRFHPTRGAMSLSKKDGGLPPDSVVQNDEKILVHTEDMIKKYHNGEKYSMLRIAIAPCSPFSVTKNIMIESLRLAEKYNVLLHTHLAETLDEEIYCKEKFGLRPVELMESIGWLNKRVWFAHMVHLSDSDIEKLIKGDVGMAHCPTSNMKLGSGIARVSELKGKIRIGLAVDGSSSNDTNNFILEIRNALLLQRVKYGSNAITSRDVLKFATIGGAEVLRMDDFIGSIEIGKAADIIMFDLNKLEFAGGLNDLISVPVYLDAKKVDFLMINGEILIENGNFVSIDEREFIEKQNKISKKLLEKI
ncbi:MAG: 8-oxoguanine deaminase [Caldisericia bacterium]|jgi:cytosine/adenosine deaminase-related metal-dependent hydrolase|nr:8-oxoguanine deaminase [Caldisericia bacterium]